MVGLHESLVSFDAQRNLCYKRGFGNGSGKGYGYYGYGSDFGFGFGYGSGSGLSATYDFKRFSSKLFMLT